MCLHMKMPDGTVGIICGARQKRQFCACGRVSTKLCDWKVPGKKSGTCDAPLCDQHAFAVAPDRDLCPEHQRAFDAWKRRHPGIDVNAPRPTNSASGSQGRLFEEST
jgi:hypothetical protein